MAMQKQTFTARSFVAGLVACAVFAVLTVYFGNRRALCVTASQIPVLPYLLLLATVLLINPVVRLIRIARPFAPAETLLVFVMGLVSSGLSTFGLSAQWLPIAGSLFNGAWNTDQTKWDRYVEPFVDESFFVAEDGIREAAVRHLEALRRANESRAVYEAALVLADAEERLAKAERELAAGRARAALRLAEKEHAAADAAWSAVRPAGPGGECRIVLETYPALLRRLGAETDAARAQLAVLEKKAFDKVALFRRGLPEELRAYPGVLPAAEDGFAGYAARLQRLVLGRKSFARLSEARDILRRSSREGVASLLGSAADTLSPLTGSTADLEARLATLNESLRSLAAAENSVSARLAALYDGRRQADQRKLRDIDDRIRPARREEREIRARRVAALRHAERASAHLAMNERVSRAISDLRGLEEDADAAGPEDISRRLAAIMAQYPAFDASLTRFLVGDLPWSHWAKPLGRWGLLVGLTYLVLLAFNVLIFRQWAGNEKLIYPLAELPERLAGADDGGGMPAVFRSGLFWVGFSISGGVLGWNLLCSTELVPGLQPLDLRHSWTAFLAKSPIEGLTPRTRSEVFFTMVGLSFLIPRKISFSLWFFYVLSLVQVLLLVWTGRGVNEDSFRADWFYTLNFRTGEAGGALLVFGMAVLWKCGRYILCSVAPSAVAGLERDERRELRTASAVFLLGSAGVILALWRGMGANLWHTLFYCVVTLLVTIALIRAVAEGGLLAFQGWAGPLHFIRAFFGMAKSWTAPALFLPLMVYNAVLFLDIKTFIAPAMANALKIRSDLRMNRWKFHGAVLAAIAVSVASAVAAEMMMSYRGGSDTMNGWFHTGMPTWLFGSAAAINQAPPAAAGGERLWVAGGAGAMALLLYLRRFLFWLPHPIGLVMLVSPQMAAYWFSIFLGWIAKSLVTKYGNKETYATVRCLFLGLIVGELLMVALAMLVSSRLGIAIPIDLNRNA
jgi:hypothetical protein